LQERKTSIRKDEQESKRQRAHASSEKLNRTNEARSRNQKECPGGETLAC